MHCWWRRVFFFFMFWGQHYWDWVWVVTSEIGTVSERMRMCVCALVPVCCMYERKAGLQLNDRSMDKPRTQREKRYLESARVRNRGGGEKGWSEGSHTHTHTGVCHRRATSSLRWDTLEVSVRSISTTVLTFSTWLPSLVFLSAALRLLDVSACSVIL